MSEWSEKQMPDFSSGFFIQNRKNISLKLPNTFIVLPAHHTLQDSADSTFEFRQDSNFWYLTGINVADLVLSINTSTNEHVLYLPEQNSYQLEWDGEIDTKKLETLSGIVNFKNIAELSKDLENAEKDGMRIGYLPPPSEIVQPYGFVANPARKNLERIIKSVVNGELFDIRLDIARLRAVKQEIEIEKIQQAIDTTAEALAKIKKNIEKYSNEAEIVRELSSSFYQNKSDGHSFQPIVASGKNASIIHYRDNDSAVAKSELLLLDVGAKVGYYAADISRVFAVGKVDERRRQIHKAVIELQDYAFSLLKPGVLLGDFQRSVEEQAQKIMRKLNCSNADEKFPHGISHFLGLDVHDAGDYSSPLEPGMVITVEPGIYLRDEGIGVRIEDDVLISKTGIINLSAKIGREL